MNMPKAAKGNRKASGERFSYPPARMDDVVDDYHGTKVADPYRWLEDAESDETVAWVGAQNEITAKYLATPEREGIKARLTELWDYPKHSIPHERGGRYFFSKNDGLQNQDVIYILKALDGEPAVVIDPNLLSEEGAIAITNRAYSEDGTLMAYALSSSGSDWQQIKIRKIDAGEDYDEVLQWCKFTGITWLKDGSGFYYNRFPEAGSVPEEDTYNYNRVYLHKLGTSQDEDEMAYEHPEAKDLLIFPRVTDDGEYILLELVRGTDPKNRIYYRKAGGDGEFIRLLDEADAEYRFIDNVGSVFYFRTDLDASRGRIIAIDTGHPGRENWREIIAEQDDVLHFALMVNNELIIGWMHHAHHILKRYDLDGNLLGEIELPGIGTIWELSGRREDTEMFFAYTSFLYPITVFRYGFGADKVTLFRGADIDFDTSQYETIQVFFNSKDGTRVPMFITKKRGLKLDGNNPTLLYGYGGFNISLTPMFSVGRLLWLENGGVYAVANLRGGSEYGEEWHQAGTLDRKQNVFDDFIAAGEWLIENKYTVPAKLAIAGGSNGGLLVAAAMTQRPDLFGAVVCQVPVIDMLRYHRYTIGKYWVSDYGNAEESPEHFKFLFAYSPLHNVGPGAVYPPMLMTTADKDDRVDPAHAKKFAAALQAADSAGVKPILLRVETRAGHGLGKPTMKLIEEASDIYAFLFKTFGMAVG